MTGNGDMARVVDGNIHAALAKHGRTPGSCAPIAEPTPMRATLTTNSDPNCDSSPWRLSVHAGRGGF
jgi:hypothetical protein